MASESVAFTRPVILPPIDGQRFCPRWTASDVVVFTRPAIAAPLTPATLNGVTADPGYPDRVTKSWSD